MSRPQLNARSLALSVAVSALGCGGKAVIDGEATSGGGGSSTTLTSSVSVTTGGGPECDENTPCPFDQFCAFAPGTCSGPGTCAATIDGCVPPDDDNFTPVCGCDGNWYTDNCFLAMASTSQGPVSQCDEPNIRAESVIGGIDRINFYVFDPAQGFCGHLSLAGTGGPQFGDLTFPQDPGWTVEGGTAYPSASPAECHSGIVTDDGPQFGIEYGDGTFFLRPHAPQFPPCTVASEGAFLLFAEGITMSFDAIQEPIDGGCFGDL